MDVIELRKKEGPELKRLLAAEREHLRDLRFRVSAGQLKNVRDVRKARFTVARILTVLIEKKLRV